MMHEYRIFIAAPEQWIAFPSLRLIFAPENKATD